MDILDRIKENCEKHDAKIASITTTSCESILRYCSLKNMFCEYTNSSGFCCITACLKEKGGKDEKL